MRRLVLFIMISLISFFSSTAFPLTFGLPTNNDAVVGEVQWTQALPGDDFAKLARRYDIGYYQLIEANPGIAPDSVRAGTIIVIPSRFILPNVPRKGIVINLAELRIYFFPKNSHKVMSYPVGIGREGWDTPVGLTSVITKVKNPTWIAPESIRQWRAKDGVFIPKSIPPGPDNPLGSYAMHIGFPGYLIHGTNDPSGVGRRSSSGCIRLFPEDIEELFSLVSKGTAVRIINDPYKAGWLKNKLYLESHLPLEEQQEIYSKDLAPMRYDLQAVTAQKMAEIDWQMATDVAEQQNGIPQVVGIAKGENQ